MSERWRGWSRLELHLPSEAIERSRGSVKLFSAESDLPTWSARSVGQSAGIGGHRRA